MQVLQWEQEELTREAMVVELVKLRREVGAKPPYHHDKSDVEVLALSLYHQGSCILWSFDITGGGELQDHKEYFQVLVFSCCLRSGTL